MGFISGVGLISKEKGNVIVMVFFLRVFLFIKLWVLVENIYVFLFSLMS